MNIRQYKDKRASLFYAHIMNAVCCNNQNIRQWKKHENVSRALKTQQRGNNGTFDIFKKKRVAQIA